jgi:DNA repair protein RadC
MLQRIPPEIPTIPVPVRAITFSRPLITISYMQRVLPTYAILAHNHPGGLATVSIADEYATMVMKHALDGVGVELRGHLIVVGNDIASIDMK